MGATKEKPDNEQAEVVEVAASLLPTDIVNGEWIENPPTPEETLDFLARQKPSYSVHVVNYADYVVPLSANKNFGTKEKPDWHRAWNLYVTVAGRLQMFNDDMANRGLNGTLEPDPTCEPAGWLFRDNDRLVYRVVATVTKPGALMVASSTVGVRYGTAWVPWQGGGGAVKSNRFEKVETSAHGRALGAWGYGVLPGSGVASLDEMLAAEDYSTIPEKPARQELPKMEHRDYVNLLEAKVTELATLRGVTPMAVSGAIVDWVKKQYNRDIVAEAEKKGCDWWWPLQDGQIILILKDINAKIEKAKHAVASAAVGEPELPEGGDNE